MRFEFNVDTNNITYNNGDTLLVEFSKPFMYVDSISNISFDFSPLDTWEDGHDISIRWSYDITPIDRATGLPHTIWSGWVDVSRNGVLNSELPSTFSKIISKNNSFLLQFRLVRRGNVSGARSVKKIVIDYIDGKAPEKPVVSPYGNDGCKANVCPTTNFSSGIRIDADPALLFRPYDVMNPAIKIYQEMSSAVSEMFGHCVRYFKTQAKIESADVVLKEYSLYEVTDVKDIKVLVPDNQFPDNAIRFLPYDMDFGDGLEIHIVREHFERAFGCDDLPEQKDYIYFPLIDRIFEIHSAYLFRDFMAAESYYKVMLFKWQDKLNVMRTNPEIDQYVNDLHESLDDVLGPEMEREFEEITKPQQYTTIAIGGFDHVRSHINEKLLIENKNLSNYFTIVAKYFYDMPKQMNWGDIAVQYKLLVNRKVDQNTAFSMWFKSTKTPLTLNTYDTLLDGYNTTENKGYSIRLNYAGATSIATTGITFKINEQNLIFDKSFPVLNSDDWHAIVVNHMNEYSQASVHIWKMKHNPNLPQTNQPKTTDLQLIYTQVLDINPEEVNPTNTIFTLRAGTTNITNVRVWKESMEEEKQPVTLNQYVVRDNDLSLLIDNAIPPLRMVKEYVR
jgi:hypothetical protein